MKYEEIIDTIKPSHYRLYDKDLVFIKDCMAKGYVKAKEALHPKDTDRIFVVEEDNHEIECGLPWINELFKFPEK